MQTFENNLTIENFCSNEYRKSRKRPAPTSMTPDIPEVPELTYKHRRQLMHDIYIYILS